jgi:hypothetical protein
MGHWVLAQYFHELSSRLDSSRALRARVSGAGGVFVSDAWHIARQTGRGLGHYVVGGKLLKRGRRGSNK